MEMRTTDVRKLRPEAWGFICPVHTPDGAPCGLLNHVTASVRIVTQYSNTSELPKLLGELGMVGHSAITLLPVESVRVYFSYCSEPTSISQNSIGARRVETRE